MRVLITGGTGFIGSRLALRCAGDGQEVLALGRTGESPEAEAQNAAELTEAGVEVRAVDMGDRAGLAEAVKGCDTVYHLAATQHEMNVPDDVFRNTNAGSIRGLLECCADAGVRRFVHGSTIGVHGDGAPSEIAEDTPLAPTNIYDVTKKDGEEAVREFGDRVESVILRIGETYGPGDRRLLKLFRGIARGKFFLIGPGANLHQPIYVGDMVDGLLAASNDPKAVGETMLMAGPEALTTRAMCETIAGVMEKKLPGFRAPLWPFLAGAFVMEKTLRPLRIQPPLHRRRMNFFLLNMTFSMKRAKEVLGFEPRVGFEKGARETAAWYREKGLLQP